MSRFDPRLGYCAVASEFGTVNVVWRKSDSRVVRIFLPAQAEIFRRSLLTPEVVIQTPPGTIADLCLRIARLVAGRPVGFELDVLDWSMTTPFQERVLRTENRIPRGMVSTYARLASKLGKPRAARAVGGALARNPFPLVIPCHRAVRSDGSPGGYGGGIDMKRRLLESEGVEFDRRGRVVTDRFW